MEYQDDFKYRIQQEIINKILVVTGERVTLNFDNSFGLVIESLLDEIFLLKQEIEQLKVIIENGLGPEDLKNDITYPPRE
jgi:hypothetical protein